MKTCCFSGHRMIAAADREWLVCQIQRTLRDLIAGGMTNFLCGGAQGFDTLAAQSVLALRNQCPQIELCLALPCQNQTYHWPAQAIQTYEAIKGAANRVLYTGQDYEPGCMQRRNRYMIDHSDICVCYLLRTRSGTGATVGYAQRQGVPVINLARTSGASAGAGGRGDAIRQA